jgi:predicted aspartyl protease
VTQRYESDGFDPAAPIARVDWKNLETGSIISDIRMLVDTGAESTLVPRSVVSQLGLVPNENQSYKLIGFDGSTSYACTVLLMLLLGRVRVQADFPVIDQDYGILGRDVLNLIRLDLDGPHLIWDFSTR